MADTVAPEFVRFVASERAAKRLAAAARVTGEGQVFQAVTIQARQAEALLRVAARRSSGLYRPSKHTEVVWVDGDSEVAVEFASLTVALTTGFIQIGIPLHCDQIGRTRVDVTFAVGSPQEPAGLFAATSRRPIGPELIVATWGEALVAFAWQCLLELVTGITGATGKDQRGNRLVPIELAVTERGIEVVPMSRHRFAGGTTLSSASRPVGAP